MKTMVLWTGIGAILGFILIWVIFGIFDRHQNDNGVKVVLSVMGAIPAAILGALFAAVSVIQKELRETRRELKHWQSIQQMDEELSKPSTQIKSAPPSGRS